MGRIERLYTKALTSPTNLRFNELIRLAEAVGFIHRNTSGSHMTYKHHSLKRMMNFQPDKKNKSKAKQYQIKDLLAFIEENNLMD
jgi:predicted RNA binding protein YcfA (HicA-like mRNA interferase family)